MIRSGLTIQKKGLFDPYPSDYKAHERFGNYTEVRPSTMSAQVDSGFSTTRTISPFQQSYKIERAMPKTVFKTPKQIYMKPEEAKFVSINGPAFDQVAFLDIFGKKTNEIVDYVGSQLKKSYFTGVPGPAGPAGPQGMAGPKGDKGEQGLQGIAGLAGAQGMMGPRGETGAMGPQGETGATGTQGEAGAMGPQGEAGAMGPQGEAGLRGEVGLMGPQGVVGNSPSEEQVRGLIEYTLQGMPDYIIQMLQGQLSGLPLMIQGEITSQLQNLPQFIQSNQLKIEDIQPIIQGLINDALPKNADIYTRPTITLPQQTETGIVLVPKVERVFETPNLQSTNPQVETVPQQTSVSQEPPVPQEVPVPQEAPKPKIKTAKTPMKKSEDYLKKKASAKPSKKKAEPSTKLSDSDEAKRTLKIFLKRKKPEDAVKLKNYNDHIAELKSRIKD